MELSTLLKAIFGKASAGKPVAIQGDEFMKSFTEIVKDIPSKELIKTARKIKNKGIK